MLMGQRVHLTQLGNLYKSSLNRPEEAVTFYRQAVDIAVESGDLKSEGLRRKNIANALRQLQRYDEARREIQRAIECCQPFGVAGRILANPSASCTKSKPPLATPQRHGRRGSRPVMPTWPIGSRGAMRRLGGGKLVDHVLGLLAQQQVDAVQSLFAELTNNPEAPDSRKQLIQAMVAILNGSRDPALADDPALDYATRRRCCFFGEG
jgi:tetratricopeptide (TPR) repeat protein